MRRRLNVTTLSGISCKHTPDEEEEEVKHTPDEEERLHILHRNDTPDEEEVKHTPEILKIVWNILQKLGISCNILHSRNGVWSSSEIARIWVCLETLNTERDSSKMRE